MDACSSKFNEMPQGREFHHDPGDAKPSAWGRDLVGEALDQSFLNSFGLLRDARLVDPHIWKRRAAAGADGHLSKPMLADALGAPPRAASLGSPAELLGIPDKSYMI